jgi:hypothetical protein
MSVVCFFDFVNNLQFLSFLNSFIMQEPSELSFREFSKNLWVSRSNKQRSDLRFGGLGSFLTDSLIFL